MTEFFEKRCLNLAFLDWKGTGNVFVLSDMGIIFCFYTANVQYTM